MLPSVTLSKCGLVTSRLAFGTSRLHYLDKRYRERLLVAATDLGITHFDTAPVYGDGLAEAELGRFISSQRDRFIISTKYGLPTDPIIQRSGRAAQLLRAGRIIARKAGLWQTRLPPITATGLRESAEHSLRRMKTDWLDILMLHEPSPERLSNPADILDQFNRLKERGLIRAFGLAGAWSGVHGVLQTDPALGQIIQTAESEWPETFPPDITYGAIRTAKQSYFGTGTRTELAVERLHDALLKRANGVVIVSSRNIQHLRRLVEATGA